MPTQDTHTWRAIYEDDTQVHEYDAVCPEGRSFTEVDSRRVKELDLLPQLPFHAQHSVLIPQGAEPVFFRRRQIVMESGERSTIQCIGYKRGDEASYCFIMPDNTTLVTTDFQAV